MTNLWQAQVTHTAEFSWSSLATDVAMGAATSVVSAGAGQVLSSAVSKFVAPVAKTAASAVTGAVRTATSKAGTALQSVGKVAVQQVKTVAKRVTGKAASSAPAANTARGEGSAYARSIVSGGRDDGSTVFAGHGEFRYGSGSFTVPEGTTLNVYSAHGRALSQADGLAIELGGGPSPVTVYGPGSVMPNYTLKAPTGLTVARGSTTVEDATPLSSLLRPGMGTCHWVACTLVR